MFDVVLFRTFSILRVPLSERFLVGLLVCVQRMFVCVHAHMYVCGVECSVVSKICADQMLICEILLFFLSLYHALPLSNRCCSPHVFFCLIFWGGGGSIFL